MAIKIITDEHKSIIEQMLKGATSTISIASPFITMSMTELLCNTKDKNSTLKATLITRFCREDFVSRVSDIKALKTLHSKGVKIYALKQLHSKVYLIDDNKALTGSANFTNGGFGDNQELSFYIENETELNSGLKKYFADLLTGLDDYLITAERIETEIAEVEKIREARKDNKIKIDDHNFGADKKPKSQSQSAIQQATVVSRKNIWIKFEGGGDNRKDLDETYELAFCNCINETITCFSKKSFPQQIANNDFVYIARHCKKNRQKTLPYIVGRGRISAPRKSEATDDMINEHLWLADFPIYCKLIDFEYFDTKIGNLIPLLLVLENVGTDTYTNTKATTLKELRTSHRQKSYLGLTQRAKEYIDKEFDKLVDKYGSKKIQADIELKEQVMSLD